MHISLDGFAAGPNGELDWISYDEELEKAAEEIVGTVGSPVYGRVTYGMMEGYWPTVLDDPDAQKHDLEHAQWLQDVEKIVFSTTLDKVEWHNARLIKTNIEEEITKLKQQSGQDLVIFGSPGLARNLMPLGLIDAYRLTINPVILGRGMPVFQGLEDKIDLQLVSSKTLNSGVIVAYYETKKSAAAS
jgi:dihydrofolate reductase